MHRLIWGIVIAVLGLFSLIGASSRSTPSETGQSVIVGFLFLAGGGVMIAFGARFLNKRKTISNFAFQMLRADNKINAGELAQRLGYSEFEVRKHIADAQRKGLIPFKADIV
jgi:predicted transcriptional regulator